MFTRTDRSDMSQKFTRQFAAAILSLTFFCCTDATAIAAVVIDLGTLGGNTSYARDVNNAGQIVGNSGGAFRWQNGSMASLGGGAGYGINDLGQVAGIAVGGHAALFQNGTMTDLGTLGGTFSTANAINNASQVVGYSYLVGSSGTAHAFVWQNGSMTDLGTLGGTFSSAYGINAAGQIVGGSTILGGNQTRAFLRQNGVMTNLGTLGGIHSNAFGINELGQIVGSARATDDTDHAFFWQNGTMSDLGTVGTNTFAYAINDGGLVVGKYRAVGNSIDRACLWQNGIMTDLNSLIIGSGWTLEYAYAVNNNGWIVGHGINPSGQEHAFLLTGVPEPSSFVLAGLGIAAIAARWRKRRASAA